MNSCRVLVGVTKTAHDPRGLESHPRRGEWERAAKHIAHSPRDFTPWSAAGIYCALPPVLRNQGALRGALRPVFRG